MIAEGSTEIAVDEAGEALTFPDGTQTRANLSIVTSDSSARIVVIDDRFAARGTGTGSLTLNLEPGLYKVRVQRGASSLGFVDRFIVLDRDLAIAVEPPPFVSPVPIAGSQVPESHLVAREWLDAVVHAAPGKGSKIALLARYHGTPKDADLPHPFEGLDLLRLDGSKVVTSLERLGSQLGVDEGVPIALCGIDVDPGIYLLRHRLAAGRRIAQTVVAVAGWQTMLTFRRSADDTIVEKGKARFRRPGVLGVLMRLLGRTGAAQPAAVGWSQAGAYDEDQLVETARQALADGTPLLDGDLNDLLLFKFRDPLAGILGGLLLDLERDRAGDDFPVARARLFDEVVGNLRSIVGPDNPDVEALSLRCVDPALRCRKPLSAPPIYHRSWRILIQAAATQANLVPLELWDRVRVGVAMPPYFAWTENAATRRTHLRKLAGGIVELQSRRRLIIDYATESDTVGAEAPLSTLDSLELPPMAAAIPQLAGSAATQPTTRETSWLKAIREESIEPEGVAAAMRVPVDAISTLLAAASGPTKINARTSQTANRRKR